MTIAEAVAYLESPAKILNDIFQKELQAEIDREVVRQVVKGVKPKPTKEDEEKAVKKMFKVPTTTGWYIK